MRTRIVSLAAAIALIPLVGLAAAAPASAATPDGALTVTPSTVPAGAATTVTVEASWVATDTNITETVMTMPQVLVDAGATWASASLSSGQRFPDCVRDTPLTQAACAWEELVLPASTTMRAVLQLPAGVAPGAYVIEARESRETTPARTVTLTVSAPPTATPTPTPTPSPSASASSVAVPTAVPAGEGPSSGSAGLSPLLLVVVLAVAGGGAWVLVRGRA